MLLVEFFAIIAFIILLGAACFMLVNFYICDSFSCKAFDEAGNKAEKGTKAYAIALLTELYNDGIWPIPYIGAAILTPISLWFIGIPITVRNFAIMFFVSFVTIYFMITFFGHHYIRIISNYSIEYIRQNCPNNTSPGINNNHQIGFIYNEDTPDDNGEAICYKDNPIATVESFTEASDITFVKKDTVSTRYNPSYIFTTPINTF